jgi:hypothetical protein
MKKNILLIILLVIFSSCESQVGTAIGHVFKNLVTGKGFGNTSSDELYKKMKDKEKMEVKKNEIAKTVLSDDSRCNASSLGVNILPSNDFKKISEIKENICSCKTWGTCNNGSCDCEVLCPKDFKIFDRPHDGDLDSPENSLSFTNGDKSFFKKDKNYTGFCWGHAVVTQRFNRLANFNISSPKKFISVGESSQRLHEYKLIIAKLNNNEPVDIPGFKNLKEFSSDPEVKELLEDSVKEIWAQNAMSVQGLSMLTGSAPESEEYNKKLFDDLEFRLKHNQSPVIVFNKMGDATFAHVVLVSGSGAFSSGERYICIRDNAALPEQSSNCQNLMIITKDGTITYTGWLNRIGKIKLSFTENSNTLEQMNNLRAKCLGDRKCLPPSKDKITN